MVLGRVDTDGSCASQPVPTSDLAPIPLGPLGLNSPSIAQRHALHVERTAEKVCVEEIKGGSVGVFDCISRFLPKGYVFITPALKTPLGLRKVLYWITAPLESS